jgi:glycosyltransferase involved in cell wall biosynthesis
VIPCYNTALYLRPCLDNVLNQTYPNLEIIISDDASTDDTPTIIREYIDRYPGRVKAIFGEQNRGAGFARNQGAAQAQGEYLTFLDGDDYYGDPRKLEYELALALAYREQYGQTIIAFSKVKDGKPPLKQGLIFEEVLLQRVMPRDYVLRRADFEAAGGYRLIRLHQDWDLCIRLAASYEFYATGIIGTVYYSQRSGSLSANQYFLRAHTFWPIVCHNLEWLVADESKRVELAYQFGLYINQLEYNLEVANRTLQQACDERLDLINELHQAAQERLEVIERQQAELARQEKWVATHPVIWLSRLLPRRLRRFLKQRWGRKGDSAPQEVYQK